MYYIHKGIGDERFILDLYFNQKIAKETHSHVFLLKGIPVLMSDDTEIT